MPPPMSFGFAFSFFALVMISATTIGKSATTPAEVICGKWELTEKNLIVQVYTQDNKFMAKIVWFKGDDGKPMESWKDENNPDESLRNRKIVGMSILKDLTYVPGSNSWEGGIIYDAKHGRDWNASAYIDKNGELKVKGYWHFKFIGKTLTFTRV